MGIIIGGFVGTLIYLAIGVSAMTKPGYQLETNQKPKHPVVTLLEVVFWLPIGVFAGVVTFGGGFVMLARNLWDDTTRLVRDTLRRSPKTNRT